LRANCTDKEWLTPVLDEFNLNFKEK
jgi:hypothetical protein